MITAMITDTATPTRSPAADVTVGKSTAPMTSRVPQTVRRTYWRTRHALLWPFTWSANRFDVWLWRREVRSHRPHVCEMWVSLPSVGGSGTNGGSGTATRAATCLSCGNVKR